MTSPNGLGLIESHVLVALHELGVEPGSTVKTSTFLDHLNNTSGIHPIYGWRTVLALSRSWEVVCPLLVFNGNNGSPLDPPADSQYTEIELSVLGRYVAQAESGHAPPLPIGLVLGDFYAGGLRPAFAAVNVANALVAVAKQPSISDAELFDIVSGPVFPIGCKCIAPLTELLGGEAVKLTLTAQVEQVGPRAIEVTGLPLVVGEFDPLQYVPAKVGISNVMNTSRSQRISYLIELDDSADLDAVTQYLGTAWPFQIEVPASFGKPWREHATEFLNQLDIADLDGHLQRLN